MTNASPSVADAHFRVLRGQDWTDALDDHAADMIRLTLVAAMKDLHRRLAYRELHGRFPDDNPVS